MSRRFPRLGRDEEAALLRRVKQGDREAWERLIASNLGLVAMAAKRLRHYELPLADMLQEGVLGLIQAARRYDERKNTRFSTYAVWWIRKAILAAPDRAGLIRVPPYGKKRLARFREAELALRASLGRAPERGEVSARMTADPADVERLLGNEPRRLSLDHCVDRERRHPLREQLPDGRSRSPEHEMIRRESKRLLVEGFGRLGRRERFVLAHRFGLDEREPLKLREIAALMGISRERVRQIEERACARLRRLYCHGTRRTLRPWRGRVAAPQRAQSR